MNKRGRNRNFSLCSFFPKKNHKGQVTIFIIIAIIIVIGIALFFIFRQQIIPQTGGTPEKNPGGFLETCMKDKIQKTIKLLSSQGGYVSNPLNITFKFDDEATPKDISYLCYTNNYYIPCINQEPMLIKHLKDEIKNYISTDVNNCFNKLTSSLENQGFTVDAKYKDNDFEVDFMEGKIIINLSAEITLTKSGETTKQTEFNIITPSRFYDTALLVNEIVNQEAKYCNFEYSGYMILYPQWSIDKLRTSDSVIIYTIKHQDDENKFRFAVRGCVMRPGI